MSQVFAPGRVCQRGQHIASMGTPSLLAGQYTFAADSQYVKSIVRVGERSGDMTIK